LFILSVSSTISYAKCDDLLYTITLSHLHVKTAT